MRPFVFLCSTLITCIYSFTYAQEYTYVQKENIPYYTDSQNKNDQYIKEKCTLDIYYPQNKKGFSTIIWFHGGGLTSGKKEIPKALKNHGICIIGVDYRLSPRVCAEKCIEDAAAATAWVFNNIQSYGGNKSLIFLSGHSAGGYLTAMVGLDKKWLKSYGFDSNHIAGLIPLSGQMITHFTIRKERGIANSQPIIDSLAPLYHVRKDAPPLVLITGDRELEMLGRYEENAYMRRMMIIAGHTRTKLYELEGYGHSMTYPAYPLLLKEVKNIIEENRSHIASGKED